MKIDLSQISAPEIVVQLTIAEIKAQILAALVALDASFESVTEADPAMKIVELCAYRESLLRQTMNDQTWGNTLAKGAGYFLDFAGAVYGLSRKLVTAADTSVYPTVAAVYESDDDFRARIQAAPESLSVAGPVGAYISHAEAVDGVKDVSVDSPTPGAVVVTILASDGDGVPAATVLSAVETALEDVRPLTDQVTVQAATLVDYIIEATIFTYSGPDPQTVITSAETSAKSYCSKQKSLGLDITLSGIYAALHIPGVQRVELASPAATVPISPAQCGHCTAIALTNGGVAQ